jgi:thiamine-monophosphate kinase
MDSRNTYKVLNEEELIQRMCARVPHPQSPYGPGDDGAFLNASGGDWVVSTDLMVEGVHFRRPHPPVWLGWKLLAVNASDIAAMGSSLRAFVITASIPNDTPLGWWDRLADGVGDYARTCDAMLLGGDVVRSPGPVMLGVTAWGAVKEKRILRRDQGKPGDVLMVHPGDGIGKAALGLKRWLAQSVEDSWGVEPPLHPDPCLLAQLRPTPPSSAGPWALVNGATAGLDLSDGLSVDATRLAVASQILLRVELSQLPHDPLCSELTVEERVCGGEDYGLLVLVEPHAEEAFRNEGFVSIGEAQACGPQERPAVAWWNGNEVCEFQQLEFSHFSD